MGTLPTVPPPRRLTIRAGVEQARRLCADRCASVIPMHSSRRHEPRRAQARASNKPPPRPNQSHPSTHAPKPSVASRPPYHPCGSYLYEPARPGPRTWTSGDTPRLGLRHPNPRARPLCSSSSSPGRCTRVVYPIVDGVPKHPAELISPVVSGRKHRCSSRRSPSTRLPSHSITLSGDRPSIVVNLPANGVPSCTTPVDSLTRT